MLVSKTERQADNKAKESCHSKFSKQVKVQKQEITFETNKREK